MVVSFVILGWIGTRIYQEMPPLPDRVVTANGQAVIESGRISAGQNVWQSLGGMEVGSIWGHGSYVAPDWTADWDTCRYDPIQTSLAAGYNLAFEAVYDELYSRMGPNMPKMLAAEVTGIIKSYDYLHNLIDTSHVYGYSHHLYNLNVGENPDSYINAMTDFAEEYGDKPLFQTEYEASTDSWPDALNLATLLHNSLTTEEVAGYLYAALVLDCLLDPVGYGL